MKVFFKYLIWKHILPVTKKSSRNSLVLIYKTHWPTKRIVKFKKNSKIFKMSVKYICVWIPVFFVESLKTVGGFLSTGHFLYWHFIDACQVNRPFDDLIFPSLCSRVYGFFDHIRFVVRFYIYSPRPLKFAEL